MMLSLRELKNLVAQGRADAALEKIRSFTQTLSDPYLDNQAVALSGRWSTNERNYQIAGLSEAAYLKEKGEIEKAVLALIDKLPKDRRAIVWMLVAGLALIILVILVRFFSGGDSMQLTVYVQDMEGKPIAELQNKGRVIVDFGNDRRAPLIGENGRTNLGEIPEKFRGDSLQIVLETEGYEPTEARKKYRMDGKPVYLYLHRDNSLGTIQGIVQTRDASRGIAGALVMIDHDTTTNTDSLGRFKIVLPERMHKTEYLLTVKKDGYKDANEFYKPKTTPADIRLEK